LSAPGAVLAQPVTVSVDDLACIPLEGHAVVEATVVGEPGGAQVRLHFRRTHQEVEDFYYVVMSAAAGDVYWGVLPDPEDQELERHDLEGASDDAWAAWWRAKEASENRDPNDDLDDQVIRERASVGRHIDRDWLAARTPAELQDWLEELENEPAEYYVAVYDSSDALLASSDTLVVEVEPQSDCPVTLTQRQTGQARNLTVGETAAWQEGKEVFHWECDGIVSRIDYRGILREDEFCRACVVAPLTPWLLGAGTAAAVAGILIDDDPPEDVSPARP
jgi:hypothetical protein